MKESIRFVVMNFFVITVGVLFVISFATTLGGVEYYPTEYPWMILLTGLLTSFPALIYHSKKELSEKQLKIRFVIHFIVVAGIVMTLGYIWKWYESLGYAVIVFLMYMFVYAIVMAYSYFIQYRTAISINKALKDFNANENNQE